ncbi:MAG TPA: long-chain fatty acid--CoA ligase [Pyrinomonadaceae bacterium]|jgi:long-chain acyl-CoA synthetase|nr:long-chain fatty acid--CoA ligase [Pyrinomonadaceae bacterium]
MTKVKAVEENEESVYAQRPWLEHYDYWVRPHLNYPRRPLHEILRITAVEVPDSPATAFLGAQLTYGQIKEQSDKLAASLSRLGVKHGDRVGIMLPNCPQYVIATFATLRLGATVVNVNPLYTPREVLLVAQDSGMRAMLTLDVLAPVTLAVREATSIENIIVTSAQEYSIAANPCPTVDGALRLADLLASVDEPELPRVEIDPEEDVAVLQYTGGTTGVPKGAMLTHYNIFANVIQTQCWGHQTLRRGEDTYLLVIPYFHIYGFTVGMMAGTWTGAQQVLIPKYDVEALLHAIRDYRPTYFPAVPTIYISLLHHPRAKEYGIDKIRTFNSGSAPLPIEVIEQFERVTGGTLNEGYGLSEASPVTHSTAMLARRKPGSIGLPLPDTDIRIVDLETGTREVPTGSEGELCVSGPQVMKGYWNRADETSIALRRDDSGRTWLYTGDVARMDEDGFTYIVQRKKDMIIVSGFNVYPSEVEGVLYTHPAVMEAAVIGIPDSYRGEAVKAFVVLKQGVSASAEELIEHCKGGLAEFKVPVRIEIRECLPKTAVGKILHRVLREEDEEEGSKGE